MTTQQHIRAYMDWSYGETARLAANPLPQVSRMVTPLVDVPQLTDERAYQRFTAAAVECGYAGCNIGLTPVWQGAFSSDTLSRIRHRLPMRAAHGTSVKAAIRSGKPYAAFLEQDLAVLDSWDPGETWTVNYDLYAGNRGVLPQGTFRAELAVNERYLAAVLGENQTGGQLSILRSIVRAVAGQFRSRKRRVVFEIPGSRGWSMLPAVSAQSLRMITRILDTEYPEAGLCLDLGHMLTWTRTAAGWQRLTGLLEPLASRIAMLHISSAGTAVPLFRRAYESYYGGRYPAWHVRGLDMMLPVCEPEMLAGLQQLRGLLAGSPLLEVSEVRTPEAAIADYFPRERHCYGSNDRYYEALALHARSCGYV